MSSTSSLLLSVQACTLEAHDFAEATDEFKKQGATVIGVTAGNTDQIAKFSQLECRDKFTVAADPGAKVAAEYKSTMEMKGQKPFRPYLIRDCARWQNPAELHR
ncbi:AhpC/TSA family [Pantoea agglomerans]|uniref:AhpC/TSA family n=1 Tax=Enterobacter agglomerans TaxID=549 RepID=A0A379LQV4_ENTAG|nr:AhpC/TSA family [Pantoea agglomerans]